MATELMTLVEAGKIRPTVAEEITLEAIPKALERLAEGHVRGKIVARMQSLIRVSVGHKALARECNILSVIVIR
jgi:hypothetical protein